MGLHIGEEIERRLTDLGMSKAEFGRRINTSRQNVSLILKKESLDTKVLQNICKVLDYNFFQFMNYQSSEGDGFLPHTMPRVRLMIELNPEHQSKVLQMVFSQDQLVNMEEF